MNPRLLITLITAFLCITCSKEKDSPTPEPAYTLTIKIAEGRGSINAKSNTSNSKTSINITGGGSTNVKSGEYASGTKLTISATADEGFKFSKWIGINSSENPVSITIVKNITVEAVFVQK